MTVYLSIGDNGILEGWSSTDSPGMVPVELDPTNPLIGKLGLAVLENGELKALPDPPETFLKPKWDGETWVEGATEEDKLNAIDPRVRVQQLEEQVEKQIQQLEELKGQKLETDLALLELSSYIVAALSKGGE